MSHFSVLVVGNNVEKQLAPYHEFECTGKDDEFVQDIDKTEEYRKEYLEATEDMLKDSDGKLHSFFDESGNWLAKFSKLTPDSFGMRNRERYVPEGYEQVTVPKKNRQSFQEWLRDWAGIEVWEEGDERPKHGYVKLDSNGEVVQVIKRTNPQKQWDWYVVGGRWDGFLKSKKTGDCNSLIKRELDIEGMRDEEGEKAAQEYDCAVSITGGVPWESWHSVRERLSIQEAREFYNSQPPILALKASRNRYFSFDIDDELAGSREAYIQSARDRAICTFAYVKDDKWTERGEMLMFGMSVNEKPKDQWNKEFSAMINALPDDTLLTVVDCHI